MLHLMLITWLIIFGLMTVVWLLYLCLDNTSIVDVFWSIAIATASMSYYTLSDAQSSAWGMVALLIIWALRLSLFLFFTRIVRRHQDKRYAELAAGWQMKKQLGFFLNFQFQGLLAMIIATPFLSIADITPSAAMSHFSLGIMAMIGASIVCETLADLQLLRFKKKHKGHVCDIGLWRYSRHPNYFFDWLTWLGFAVLASQVDFGWMSYLSPMLLLFLMRCITIPMTEKQSLASRGQDYANYQARTSIFLPKWRKK